MGADKAYNDFLRGLEVLGLQVTILELVHFVPISFPRFAQSGSSDRVCVCVCVCVCVRMFWRQELTDAIAQDIRKMPKDDAKGILDKLVGPGDYPNPKKDLSDLAHWERLVQLRRDAPIREHPLPAPSPHFPTQSAAVGPDIFQGICL